MSRKTAFDTAAASERSSSRAAPSREAVEPLGTLAPRTELSDFYMARRERLGEPAADGRYCVSAPTVTACMLDLVHKDYGINHATIQLERTTVDCAEDHHVDHLLAKSQEARGLL